MLAQRMAARTRQFRHEGHRLVYDEHRGDGDRPVVLLPGLLFSRKMHEPLAEALAARGHRVLCLDFLGHGDSDRPPEMWRYSMPIFGRQTLALLDHAEIEQAVVGGTSLGGNVTLELAALAPQRVRGMLIDMPVLDNALLGAVLGLTPLLALLTFGAPVARVAGRVARAAPRGTLHLADMILDWISQDPKPSASVLQGIFFGRVAPPRSERRRMGQRALVIGHPRDPIHPFSDADMLVRELPNARLLEAGSIVELRLTPERLTRGIADFVGECWQQEPPVATGRQARAARRRTA
jgi:pimeloyl-ACP methyl ester carboxylesterase